MESTDDLVRFIRQTLGCECPDEVLRSTQRNLEFAVPNTELIGTRLDVGGRLLVYVVEVPHEDVLPSLVPAAVEAGIADRDLHKFNRFRLALATSSTAAIERSASQIIDGCHCPDGRIHLHVVDVNEVPEAARPIRP